MRSIDSVRHRDILDKDIEAWTKEDLKMMVEYYTDLCEKFKLSEMKKRLPEGEKENLEAALKVTF